MRIVRSVAAAAILGATAVAFAGTAAAEDLAPGMYNADATGAVTTPGSMPMMWRVVRCGDDCAQISDGQGTTWDSTLKDGQWSATRHSATAVDCKNGFFAPGTSVFTLDPQTLRGAIISTSDGAACGSPAPVTSGPSIVFLSRA